VVEIPLPRPRIALVRALVFKDGTVQVASRPDPVPGRGELLVRVVSAGINGADLLQQAGRYPAPPGDEAEVPGLEIAGTVIGCGEAVQRFAIGDNVMALMAGGGQAELAVVHERIAMPAGGRATMTAAGGFPEVFTTAHDALFSQAGLGSGERVLVTGAAGGVGSAAVQLAAAAGASVVASVRDESLRPRVAALGAACYSPEEAVLHGPFDVVLELVGAPSLASALAHLEIGGRAVVIGVGAGARMDLDLRVLMSKRARLSASTLRARTLEEKATAARLVERHVLPLLEAGKLEVLVAATYDLTDAAAAYSHFAAGHKLGKVILTFASSGNNSDGASSD